jgi:hypothetical protein
VGVGHVVYHLPKSVVMGGRKREKGEGLRIRKGRRRENGCW